jgi:hypothetical protein
MNSEKKDAPPTTARTWTRADFKTPPVVSRHFLVHLGIHKEDFEQRASSLMDIIQSEGQFEQRGLNARWDFRLDLQGKAPKPKVLLTHIPVVTRGAKNQSPKTVVELYPPIEGNPAQLHISQNRTDMAAASYEDLEREVEQWLPLTMNHFDLARVGGFVLEYRNLIQRDRYPMFWEGEKTLQLGRLLWLFQNNPGPGNFVTPFSVEFNTASPLPGGGNVRFHLETNQNGRQTGRKQEVALQVTLAYNSLARKEKHAWEDLIKEMSDSHRLLFENFIRQFTPTALEAFT